LLNSTHAQKLVIDLRDNQTGIKYYVGLAVRNDTYTGHAFVITCKQEPNDSIMLDLMVYGYYPKEFHSISTPIGIMKNDTKSIAHIPNKGDLYFIVNKGAYDSAKFVVNRWTAHPPIFTLIFNCIDLLDEVAMAIGIDLPSRYLSFSPRALVPEHYMEFLKKKLYSKKGFIYKNEFRIRVENKEQPILSIDSTKN
jgi:hypothetical protein